MWAWNPIDCEWYWTTDPDNCPDVLMHKGMEVEYRPHDGHGWHWLGTVDWPYKPTKPNERYIHIADDSDPRCPDVDDVRPADWRELHLAAEEKLDAELEKDACCAHQCARCVE